MARPSPESDAVPQITPENMGRKIVRHSLLGLAAIAGIRFGIEAVHAARNIQLAQVNVAANRLGQKIPDVSTVHSVLDSTVLAGRSMLQKAKGFNPQNYWPDIPSLVHIDHIEISFIRVSINPSSKEEQAHIEKELPTPETQSSIS